MEIKNSLKSTGVVPIYVLTIQGTVYTANAYVKDMINNSKISKEEKINTGFVENVLTFIKNSGNIKNEIFNSVDDVHENIFGETLPPGTAFVVKTSESRNTLKYYGGKDYYKRYIPYGFTKDVNIIYCRELNVLVFNNKEELKNVLEIFDKRLEELFYIYNSRGRSIENNTIKKKYFVITNGDYEYYTIIKNKCVKFPSCPKHIKREYDDGICEKIVIFEECINEKEIDTSLSSANSFIMSDEDFQGFHPLVLFGDLVIFKNKQDVKKFINKYKSVPRYLQSKFEKKAYEQIQRELKATNRIKNAVKTVSGIAAVSAIKYLIEFLIKKKEIASIVRMLIFKM